MSEQKPSDRVRIVKSITEAVIALALIGAVLYSCTRQPEPAVASAVAP